MRIVACPIVREADGLAMSSRNVYLDEAARLQATALNRALDAAVEVFTAGEREGRGHPIGGSARCSKTTGSLWSTWSSAMPRR